jgi:LPXTG-motif cell wall-anchored protein
MQPSHITPRPVLVAFACALALVFAIPAFASADGPPVTSERDSAPTAQSLVGDRPSERDSGAAQQTTSAAAPSTSDDGTNVALIIGLSLAGLAAGGATWVVVRRRHHGGLTPTGSA